MIKFVIIIGIILVIVFLISYYNPKIPYIRKGILYLELKEIPIKDIIQIELDRDPILNVIIHHKNGMYLLPYLEYLKIEEKLWTSKK